MFDSHANEVLGAMITPAVLISASGTLVLSTGNRLGRVVDRVRALTEEAEKMATEPTARGIDQDEKRNLIITQITQLATRIQLQQALTEKVGWPRSSWTRSATTRRQPST